MPDATACPACNGSRLAPDFHPCGQCTDPATPTGPGLPPDALARGGSTPEGREGGALASVLPPTLAGHWESDAGHEMAVRYAQLPRRQLGMADRTDFALANDVYLVDRYSLDLLAMQTAAKERIRWLSVQLAMRDAAIATALDGLATFAERAQAWADDAAVSDDERVCLVDTRERTLEQFDLTVGDFRRAEATYLKLTGVAHG